MRLLSSSHKTPFWSPFLLGILAILSVPEFQAHWMQSRQADETVLNQAVSAGFQADFEQENAADAAFYLALTPPKSALEAVKNRDFFADLYAFDGNLSHPIRAGPLVI